jgi:non-specific serine/threonine protein kinase
MVLGFICFGEGDWAAAVEHLEQAVKLADSTAPEALVRASSVLAEIDLLEGRPAAAQTRVLALLSRFGPESTDNAYLLPKLAWAHLNLGEVAQAEETAAQAISFAQTAGDFLNLVEALRVQALVRMAQQRWAEAEQVLAGILVQTQSKGYPWGEARVLDVYGVLHLRQGQFASARQRLEAALAIFSRLGAQRDTARLTAALAGLGSGAAPQHSTGGRMQTDQPVARTPFGRLLRRSRLAVGLSQEALAERAGLSWRTISDLERGVNQGPRGSTARLLADALALGAADRAALLASAAPSDTVEAEPASPAGAPPAATAPNNLPLALSSFVGRERELAAVRRLLSQARLLTLVGAGGCGKTRLALEVARALAREPNEAEAYADGVWLVELAPLADPALVPRAVAQVLGLREEPGRALPECLARFLQPKHLLLLLDNCEHLVAACAALAEALLRACPRLAILATSREALRIGGERPWRVPSLGLPDPGAPLTPEQALACEAIQLFVQRAEVVRPDFRLTMQNVEAVSEICRGLDGVPLAIELAAARISMLPPTQLLAAWLQRRLRLLTGGARDLPPRQRTMRAAIAWSHDLLQPPEQVVFRRLAVFAGGCTLDATEAICRNGDGPSEDLFESLCSLVDQSLVRQEEHVDGDARFTMLETVREYALEQLVASGETMLLREQHAAYFLALVEQVRPYLEGAEQTRWLNRLEREHDNLRAALHWSAQHGDAERGMRGAAALWPFWLMRGHLTEGRAQLAELLALPQAATPSAARADALNTAGALARYQGDFAPAAPLIMESLAIRRARGDLHGIADAQANLGYVALYQGDGTRARSLYEDSLAIYRMAGNAQGMADALSHLGVLALYRGDVGASRALHEESLALWRQVEDGLGIAWAVSQLGKVALHETDNAHARDLFRASLLQHRELGDQWGLAEALEGLACVAAAADQPGHALRLAGAAAMLRARLNTALPLAGQADLERRLAPVRQALSEAATALWAAGRRLTVEQAIDEALEVAAG